MEKIILYYKFVPVTDPDITMRWQRELRSTARAARPNHPCAPRHQRHPRRQSRFTARVQAGDEPHEHL